jgi:uncharacterized protein with NAD-binding domain and iron-sulfur cluster
MVQSVVIIGGGVAGMSAAHELASRGFKVSVYEKQPTYVGGKARSVDVPNTGTEGRKDLPGEHGFRFFPGFYKHITDTMQHIPFVGNKKGVFDNLVVSHNAMMARFGKPPIVTLVNFPKSLSDLEVLLKAFVTADTGLTEEDAKFFAAKLWQLATSCYERRSSEYERIAWWQYMDADRRSEAFKQYFVTGLTRTLVAAKSEVISTKTGGDILLQLMFLMLEPNAQTDRVLNSPTNDAWLYPWYDYLIKTLGIDYQKNHTGIEILFDEKNEVITGVKVQDAKGTIKTVTGDYYIFAVPVERMSELLKKTPTLEKSDKTLSFIHQLSPCTSWMTGIQFYLNKELAMPQGHTIYTDTPWALTSISQVPFWKNFDINQYGNGKTKAIFSIDVSDWFTNGIIYNKPASKCTKEEIKTEVWEQLKRSLIDEHGKPLLTDDMLVDWYLDRDITFNDQNFVTGNEEPLLINQVNTWALRPEAYTAINNMFLASDYVRTHTDLATMEGANEAARRATNAILKASKSSAPLCEIWDLHEPSLLAIYRWWDKRRWQQGLPWENKFPFWLQVINAVWYFIKWLINKIF